MQAPDRIYANASVGDGGFWACDADGYDQGDCHEYHLARPGQRVSTDQFLRMLQEDGNAYEFPWRIALWLSGDFTAAMEGME